MKVIVQKVKSASCTVENKVVGKIRADGLVSDISGNIDGSSESFSATAVDLKGRYLGRLLPEGRVVKSSEDIGLVGARGLVYNASGNVVGVIVKTGPVFDYKGELRGHALSNGSVISLSGTTIGYVIGDDAYNLSGIKMGSLLKTKVVFDNEDVFMGVSGISSMLDSKGVK